MDLYYIYIKQETFVCGSEMCLWIIFLIYGLILHLHMTVSICVCIEMYLWEESHLYMNHKIQVWILLCAFINIDTKITP